MTILITGVNESLQVVLDAAPATNQLPCSASYADQLASGGDFTANTNGTTPVTIVSAPAAGVSRVINGINIPNTDTDTRIVTINKVVSGTSYRLKQATLPPGFHLGYGGGRWYVTDTNGAILGLGATGAAGNTILTTSGAPSSGTGNNGDYAYDPVANIMYGPKSGGTWPAGTSLAGAVIVDSPVQGNFRLQGSVIRQATPGTAWGYINDSSHLPVGFNTSTAPILNVDGTLTLTYNFTASKVGAFLVTIDESYARTGLFVGASVGTNVATLTACGPYSMRLNNLTVALGNYLSTAAGYTVDTTTAVSAGTIVFAHPAVTYADANGPPIQVSLYAPGGNDQIVPTVGNKTGFTLQAQNRICGKIVIASGALTVTAPLLTLPTAVWNTSTNEVDITHATSSASSPFDASVIAVGGAFMPVISDTHAPTSTVLHVKLIDWTGAQYTGATAPTVTFQFKREGFAPAAWSSSNKIWVQRAGTFPLSFNDVSGTNADLWIWGGHST